MPLKFTKTKITRWIPLLLACIPLLVLALWGRHFLQKEESSPRSSLSDTAPFSCVLKTYEGKVARFEGDSATPTEIYDVTVATLPDNVQRQLAQGIPVESEDDLYTLLENFTS